MTEVDCSFHLGDKWFRYRAAAIIRAEGKALFVYGEKGQHYYSPGGAVRHGEKAEDAVRRELFEETGVEFQIERLLCGVENFFRGRYGSIDQKLCHSLELYYLMKANHKMTFTGRSVDMEGGGERLVWLPMDKLEAYDIRPSVLISLVREPPQNFVILATTKDRKWA